MSVPYTFNNQRLFLLFVLLVGGLPCMAQFGSNFVFDGATQTVSTPTNMLNGATVFTIECWVKTTESRTNATYWQRPTLVGNATNGDISGDFGITTNNGYIGMWAGLNTNTDNSFLSTTVQVNDNNWHHIAAVNNGSTIQLFVDGSGVGSIVSGKGLTTSAAPISIGGSTLDFGFGGNYGNSNFFHQGLYDEARLSSSVRYTGNFTVPGAPFATDASTVALYHFDGCTAGLVPDASANANNGTPHNFTGGCALVLPAVPNLPANPVPASIVKAEYYYDTVVAFGGGTNLPITAGTNVTASNVAVNIASLKPGVHRLYVRTQTSDQKWSLSNQGTFYIVPASATIPANIAPAAVAKAEYFFDTDPGFGAGTAIPVTPGTLVTASNIAVNITGLAPGVHRLYIRTANNNQRWSITNNATFYVVPASVTIPANPTLSSINNAEYFIDADPGIGQATAITVPSGTNVTVSNLVINIGNLANGVHRLYLRTKDAKGAWSATNFNVFSIVLTNLTLPPNPVVGNITKFEYFIDTDPGFGHGKQVSISPTTNLANYTFGADISGLADGKHTFYIRSFDGWSLTNAMPFMVGMVLPVTWLNFSAQLLGQDSVRLQWKTTNETNVKSFVVERSGDGNTFTPIGTVPATTNPSAINSYSLVDAQPLQGVSYYRVKQLDVDGKYTYSAVIAVKIANTKNLITVLPNPFVDAIKINIEATTATGATLSLVDVQGKTIKAQAVRLQAGTNTFGMDGLGNLSQGTYLLRYANGQQTVGYKLLKQ